MWLSIRVAKSLSQIEARYAVFPVIIDRSPGRGGRLLCRMVLVLQKAYAKAAYFLRTGYWQTRERVNPDFPDDNFQNHFKVYRFIAQWARDRNTLDVGCGTSYG